MPILKSSGLHYLPYDETKLLERQTITQDQKRDKATQKLQESTTILHVSRKGICGFKIIHFYDCTESKSGGLLRRMWEATGYLSHEQI